MDEKLLAEAQVLRTMYHRWCTFEREAPGYSELCIERTPGNPAYEPTALGMVAEAGRRVLTVLLDSSAQAEMVWDGCIDNGEDVLYNIAYVHDNMCRACPTCKVDRLIADEDWHDGFAAPASIYVAQLECGHQFVDTSGDSLESQR